MRKGIKTIIAGASLFILGAIIVPVAIVLPLILGGSNEKQFKIPGNAQVLIEEPGRYYLWNDYQTVFEGKSYNRTKSIPDGIEIRITETNNGELLDFVGDASVSSSRAGSSRNTIGYIEVQYPCSVEIEVAGGEEERVFSFSEFKLLKMLRAILGGFALSLIVVITGLGITIWGIVKLVGSKKKSEQVAPADADKPCR